MLNKVKLCKCFHVVWTPAPPQVLNCPSENISIRRWVKACGRDEEPYQAFDANFHTVYVSLTRCYWHNWTQKHIFGGRASDPVLLWPLSWRLRPHSSQWSPWLLWAGQALRLHILSVSIVGKLERPLACSVRNPTMKQTGSFTRLHKGGFFLFIFIWSKSSLQA